MSGGKKQHRDSTALWGSEYSNLVSWAEIFDDTEPDVRKMIIARLVERIEVGADYSIKIRLRINMRQYTGKWRNQPFLPSSIACSIHHCSVSIKR